MPIRHAYLWFCLWIVGTCKLHLGPNEAPPRGQRGRLIWCLPISTLFQFQIVCSTRSSAAAPFFDRVICLEQSDDIEDVWDWGRSGIMHHESWRAWRPPLEAYLAPHCGEAGEEPLYFNQTPAKDDSHQTSSSVEKYHGRAGGQQTSYEPAASRVENWISQGPSNCSLYSLLKCPAINSLDDCSFI